MFHAAGQAFKSVRDFVVGGESQKNPDQADTVDLVTPPNTRSEEPGAGPGTYWSENIRDYLDEVNESQKLPRDPNYRLGDSVIVAGPSPAPSKPSNMPKHKTYGKRLGPKPYNTLDSSNPTKPAQRSSFQRVISRPSAVLLTSQDSQHSSMPASTSRTTNTQEDERRTKRRKITTTSESTTLESTTSENYSLLDLAMTGLKPVQKSNSRPQSASDRLEAQKQQDRQQQRPSKSKSRYTNEDESRGEGFNSDVNVDEEMNIKPVMTLTGLSPSVPSQTISGNTNELQGATSITCMKSRPRGHGGTSRSIRRTLNGTNAGDTAMEDIAPELPSQHNKNVMSISEQSEAGQAVVQSEDSEEEDGDIMKSSRRPAKRNLGLLKTFHDVGGYSLGRGLYIWHNQKDDRFDVTQDDAEPIAILFSQLKTFAIDPGGNGVFCLLEGVKSPYGGCGGLVTYWAGLQFSSPNGLKDFTGCLRNKNISSNTSHNEDWITNSIQNKKNARDAYRRKKTPKPADQTITTPQPAKNTGRATTAYGAGEAEARHPIAEETHQPKTPKLRNQMQGDGDETPTTARKKLRSTDRQARATVDESSSREHNTRARGLPPQAQSDTDSTPPPAGSTRSSGRETTKQRSARQIPAKKVSTRALFNDTDFAACPWKSALLYPSKGPGRATVEFVDLERLDDEAYLNDNLISFGLRYLQEQCPATKSKVYIFNSFFYNTLAGKGRKDIDYDAVKRWTSKVDLFSYDHVVVPINAGMHWYWAIICNIRNVFAESGSEASQESMVDEQAEKLVGLDINTEHEEAAPRTSRKNDPTAPTIVTLDSLHNPHSPVTVNLRKYVIEEAKNKKGKAVDQSFIKGKGMTSKEIPSQVNLTDCGLHLIITIGELLSNPDKFVAKLIGKSFNNEKDFAGWEDMSEYREKWFRIVLNEYNNQTGGEYAKVVAKARAVREHDQKLKDVEASKTNPPFVPQTPGRLLPSTNSTTSAPPTKQRSASPLPLKSTRKEVPATIDAPYRRPDKQDQSLQLASAPSHGLSSSSEEDVRSSSVRSSTAEIQRAQSPLTSFHVTDKLKNELEDKEVIARSESVSFVANSQPEHGAGPRRNENDDELEIMTEDAYQKDTNTRHDSPSPAKQVIDAHTYVEEQRPGEPASLKISQTLMTAPRTVRKARKPPQSSPSIHVEASQDVEQPPLVSIPDTLKDLVRSVDPSRLSRANDNIYDRPSPYSSKKDHEDDIILQLPSTQDSDELGESQDVGGSGLLGAVNSESGTQSADHDRKQIEVVDLEQTAAEVQGVEGQAHCTQRRVSPFWPRSPTVPAPRSSTPEL